MLPGLIGTPGARQPIRVWSAGCASGEEAYSIAILLAEALGIEAFRERVKIYATDVDEEALSQARHAAYAARAVEDVPPSSWSGTSTGRTIASPSTRTSVARSSSAGTT